MKFNSRNYLKNNSYLLSNKELTKLLTQRTNAGHILIQAPYGADVEGLSHFLHSIINANNKFYEEEALLINSISSLKKTLNKIDRGTLFIYNIDLLKPTLKNYLLNAKSSINTWLMSVEWYIEMERCAKYSSVYDFHFLIPPLSKRPDDLKTIVSNLSPSGVFIRQEALDLLLKHSWDGDYQELREVMFKLRDMVNNKRIKYVSREDVHSCIRENTGKSVLQKMLDFNNNAFVKEIQKYSLTKIQRLFEFQVINTTLEATKGRKALAAKCLGIPPSTLESKIKRYSHYL